MTAIGRFLQLYRSVVLTQSCRSDLVKAVTQKWLSGRSDEQPRLSNDQAKGRRAFAASGDQRKRT